MLLLYQKLIIKLKVIQIFCYCSSRSFIVLNFAFKCTINSGLIWYEIIRSVSKLILFLQIYMQLCTICWIDYLIWIKLYFCFFQRSIDYVWGFISDSFINVPTFSVILQYLDFYSFLVSWSWMASVSQVYSSVLCWLFWVFCLFK